MNKKKEQACTNKNRRINRIQTVTDYSIVP